MLEPDKENSGESQTVQLLKKQNVDLRHNLAEALAQNSRIEEGALALTGEIDALKRQLREAGQSILEFRHRASTFKQENEKLTEHIKQLSSEVRRLTDDMDQQERLQTDEIQQLTRRLKTLHRYRNRIRRFVGAGLLNRTKVISEQHQIILQYQNRDRVISANLDQLGAEKTLLLAEIETRQAWYQEEIDRLKKYFTELGQDDRRTGEQLSLQLQALESEKSTALNELSLQKERFSLIEDQLAKARKAIESLQTEIVDSIRKMRDESARARRAEEELRTITTELERVRVVAAKVPGLQRSGAKLSRDKDRLLRAARNLRNTLRNAIDENDALKQRQHELISENKSLRERSLAFERKLADQDRDFRKHSENQTVFYEQRVESLKKDLARTIEQTEELRRNSAQLIDDSNRYRPEIEAQKERAAKAERERDQIQLRFNQELDRYANIVMKLRTRSFSRGTENSGLRKELTDAQRRIIELEEENRRVRDEMDGLNALWAQTVGAAPDEFKPE